jgi:hypothetical protein
MKNPVDWFEIYVQEMGGAKAFHAAVFGVSFTAIGGGAIEMWGLSHARRRLRRLRHRAPLEPAIERMGINARLMAPDLLAQARAPVTDNTD